MMNALPRLVAALGIVLALGAPGAAQTAALKLGDRAPALTVGTWLRGGPIGEFEPGKVYVLELCATWSPTLRDQSIPFLNRLQNLYRDRVTLVGVTVRESTRNAPENFLVKAPPIDYAFATDDVGAPPPGTPDDRVWAAENGGMSQGWLKASGRATVPTAFIIDREGRVAWIGNTLYPRGELGAALDQVLAGTLTPEASAALSEKYRLRDRREKEADARFRRATGSRDYKAAVAALDDIIAQDEALYLPLLARQKFEILLTQLRDPKGACDFAASALEGPLKDHAEPLNAMSWILMSARDIPAGQRDLDLALRLATRADEITQHKRPEVLDTLARAHYERKDLDRAIALQAEAVELQRRAVEAAVDKETPTFLLQALEATLKKYQDDKSRRGGG